MNHTTPNATTQNATRFVGVDVHKETLHFDTNDRFRGKVPNQDKDILKTLRALQAKNGATTPLHVCCEATGIHTRPLANACWKLGIPFSILNPHRVRQYAESTGQLAKTDKADARIIRLFAAHVPPKPLAPPDATREKLRQTHDMRDTWVEERTRLSNALPGITLPAYRREVQARLRALDARVDKLEARLQEIVDEAEPALAGLIRALDGITGVALLTATKLAAHCPELGSLTRRGSANLAGLAPFPKDSGNASSPRHIRGGRKPLRDALYMAAHVATLHDPTLKAFYQRLRLAGKPHNVALTAAMRKLFYHANVVAASYLHSLAAPALDAAPSSSTSVTAS